MKYYFTFGIGHYHKQGYILIEAENYGSARDQMTEWFGNNWAFQYDESQFAGQAEKYNLHEVKP